MVELKKKYKKMDIKLKKMIEELDEGEILERDDMCKKEEVSKEGPGVRACTS